MSAVTWQPHAGPLVLLACVVLATTWVVVVHRRMGRRWGSAGAWWLVAPKLVVLSLLLLALLDPTLEIARPGPQRSVLLLVDQSSSMDISDPDQADGRTRRARALALAQGFTPPGGLGVEVRYFDTAVHAEPLPAGAPADAPATEPRGTDIAACLQQAARSTAAGACAGIVLLTDGGDEPVPSDGLPAVPISAIGIGSDLQGATNAAIIDLQAPATAERGVAFTLEADCLAVGPPEFLAQAGAVRLRLERRVVGPDTPWTVIDETHLDLRHGRARGAFSVTPHELGPVRYRVSLEAQPQEISLLDNQRVALVDVRERALHVLYYSRTLGIGYKPLRSELSRDPGIGFTALFQTIGGRLAARTGARFTVQGERGASDDALGAGFPDQAASLAPYDCIILGSFPITAWNPAQEQALTDYVAGGGSVVFLGGDQSFGLGGYADKPLAALMPWQIRGDEPPMARGELQVTIDPQAGGHAITQGLAESFSRGARIESVNSPGPLRGGAQALLDTVVDGASSAVVAVQTFGKGKVMGIASDTLWRLNDSAGATTFGVFWRQAVRFLSDRGEGGQVLRVTWDQAAYRPGQSALATVHLTTGGASRLTVACDGPDGHRDLTPAAQATTDGAAWTVTVPFSVRGDYHVRMVAYRDAAILETYDKVLDVAPSLPEGAHLSRDDAGLAQLAQAHGGIYATEAHPEALTPWLEDLARAQRRVEARSVVFGGWWWFVLVFAVLLGEWILRRRRNLV